MSLLRFLLLLILPIYSGHAHDLWIEKETGSYSLYQGHRYSSHGGTEVVPYEATSVKRVLCGDGADKPIALMLGKTYPVKFAGDCAVLLASFSSGYWTKTAWETKNVPKNGISGVVKSWYSEESLKYIERWSNPNPMGVGLEITPKSNPLTLLVGDKLTVLVTDNGKPVAGVPVAYAGDTRGATGTDGKVSIRLRQQGVQLIEASMETPLTDGKADTSIRTASLQFWSAK
jgi:nickel transport protein